MLKLKTTNEQKQQQLIDKLVVKQLEELFDPLLQPSKHLFHSKSTTLNNKDNYWIIDSINGCI